MPELFRPWRYSDFPWLRTKPKEKLQNGVLDWSGKGLLLRGVNGSGKSCFAAAALRSMLHPSHPRYLGTNRRTHDGIEYRDFEGAARWWYAVDLTDHMLSLKFTGRGEELWKELMRPQVVILDDIGKERIESPPVREALVQVMQRWLDSGKFLIVTTNVMAKDPHQDDDAALLDYETSIGSRLLELTEIILPDIDRRQP